MATNFRFARLWIDLDITAGPVGSGYELWSSAGKVATVVLEEPSPFESAQESFQRLLQDYLSLKGAQLRLDI